MLVLLVVLTCKHNIGGYLVYDSRFEPYTCIVFLFVCWVFLKSKTDTCKSFHGACNKKEILVQGKHGTKVWYNVICLLL